MPCHKRTRWKDFKKIVQFLKAYDSINVIPLGIVTLINDEQFEKQLLLINTIEFGIVILDNEEQPEKDAVPMNDTEFGIVIFVINEQFRKQLNIIDSREFGSVIVDNAEQPEKHDALIDFKLVEPKVTFVKLMKSLKAAFPNWVNDDVPLQIRSVIIVL